MEWKSIILATNCDAVCIHFCEILKGFCILLTNIKKLPWMFILIIFLAFMCEIVFVF